MGGAREKLVALGRWELTVVGPACSGAALSWLRIASISRTRPITAIQNTNYTSIIIIIIIIIIININNNISFFYKQSLKIMIINRIRYINNNSASVEKLRDAQYYIEIRHVF